jgi:high-affinity nickel permease
MKTSEIIAALKTIHDEADHIIGTEATGEAFVTIAHTNAVVIRQLAKAVIDSMEGKSDEEGDKKSWDLNASRYGVLAEHFGKTILVTGKLFRLVGINPNRPKYPFTAVNTVTKRRFKFSDMTVRAGLGLPTTRF